jgi:acetylornithine deacetylase/succinyl-diaminopimelate desuccinylase-like protein
LDFLALCRQSIAIDSTPVHGTKDIMDWASQIGRDRGFQVEIQSDFVGDLEQKNVIFRPQEKSETSRAYKASKTSETSKIQSARILEEFLFQSHLDSLDPGPFQLWKDTFQNPFDATIKDKKIFGLGAADGKIDFLCKLEALTPFVGTTQWRLPPVLVATYGSHLGMIGALKLIRRNTISPKMALIGEATDLSLTTAAPGFALVEIQIPFSTHELQQRRDHESRESTSTQSKLFSGANPAESAIRKMFDYLIQLPENITLMEIDGGSNPTTVATNAFLELDLATAQNSSVHRLSSIYRFIKNLEFEFQAYRDPSFSPPYPVLNIGLVRTLEEHIQIMISCKLPPIITVDVYEDWISRMKAHCESMGSSFRVTDYKKPYRSDNNSTLVQGCLDILKTISPQGVASDLSTTNEASLFSRIGINCVCFGPGRREENIHTPHEHLDLDDIPKTISFYKKVIERFCL